jgi:hypothetical protein
MTTTKTTFIGRRRVAPDYPYAEYDEKGDYLPDENGKKSDLISLLRRIVADDSRPTDERERAVEVLKFYSEIVSSVVDAPWPEGTPQSIIDRDIAVAKGFGWEAAQKMWYEPEDVMIHDWPQSDNGSGYASFHPSRVVNSKRYHGPQAFEMPKPQPQPQPIQSFAVPLPTLEPTKEEKQAVRDTQQRFSIDYSPEASARRVAAIEAKKNVLPISDEIDAWFLHADELNQQIADKQRELAALCEKRDRDAELAKLTATESRPREL